MNQILLCRFHPLELGGNDSKRIQLQHRVVLAPLTRNRATEPGLTPSSVNAEYYSQRASQGGLLITEATYVSPSAAGYTGVPGIFTEDQVEGWKLVTQAVHAKGGVISCQLWHCGRVSTPGMSNHPLLRNTCVSASSVAIPKVRGKALTTITYNGVEEFIAPRALSIDDIQSVRQSYVNAARNAMRAGFDLVEVHAAHGYLIDQFLVDSVNRRTDSYGGSVANRSRLLLEVLGDLTDLLGPGKVAVRLSPTTRDSITYYGAVDSDPDALYGHAISALNSLPLAYILLTEPRWTGGFISKTEFCHVFFLFIFYCLLQ